MGRELNLIKIQGDKSMTTDTIQALFEAGHHRHSVRNFLPNKLPEEVLTKVDGFISEIEVPFEHNTSIKRFRAEVGKRLYNNGINAPDNLAIIADTDLVSISKAGFVGNLLY